MESSVATIRWGEGMERRFIYVLLENDWSINHLPIYEITTESQYNQLVNSHMTGKKEHSVMNWK